MAVNPRSRAAQINSEAGESPSVNIPVLPVVGNPEPTRLKTWAIALVNQLDILFVQLKDSIVNLQKLIDNRPTWLDPYEPFSEVRALTMVEDSGWLMISNKRTQEKAGPVPEGPPENVYSDTPPFVTQSLTGLVSTTTSWVLDQATGGLCQEYRIWVPDVGPNITYLLEVIVRQGPDGIPYSRTFPAPFVLPNQWNLIALADLPLSIGSQITMRLSAINIASNTPLGPFPWNYAGANNSVEPKAGEWAVNSQNTRIRIAKFDADGTDQTSVLLGATAGTIGSFEKDGDPSTFKEYIVIASPVDPGPTFEYIEFPLNRQLSGGGTFKVGDRTDISGEVPVAQPTDYSEIVDYFPAGDPSWGTSTSALSLDGIDIPSHEDDGYGVDLAIAPGVISPDWDYMSYAPVSDQGGGEGQRWSSRAQRELDIDVIRGAVQTTDGAWTEVLRYDVNRTHRGVITTEALRSDANDAYSSRLAFLCLLNGSLTLQSTMLYEHSTAPSIRARIDSTGTFLLVEVQANNNQTWDWEVAVLQNDVL